MNTVLIVLAAVIAVIALAYAFVPAVRDPIRSIFAHSKTIFVAAINGVFGVVLYVVQNVDATALKPLLAPEYVAGYLVAAAIITGLAYTIGHPERRAKFGKTSPEGK